MSLKSLLALTEIATTQNIVFGFLDNTKVPVAFSLLIPIITITIKCHCLHYIMALARSASGPGGLSINTNSANSIL